MAFDLAAALANVSDSDTGREQIQYIPLAKLVSDEQNFYALSGLEDLAANIAAVGLQQPIRVREDPACPSQYRIVSGHRRGAALELLAREDPDKWGEAPCIVETSAASPALQQLRLIFANANTRVLTSAEIGEQAAQVEQLLYQLKEEGYEFPGRMRDHVAQAVGASKSKLARLKVIREKLLPQWEPAYRANKIGESVAYALAQLPEDWQQRIFDVWGDKPSLLYEGTVQEFHRRFQKIARRTCPDGSPCRNWGVMMNKSCKDRWTDPCATCCLDCVSLQTCKSACTAAQPKKRELQDTAKQAQAQAKERTAKRDASTLALIRGVYQRIGQARVAAGVSVEELYAAQGRVYTSALETEQVTWETQPDEITNTSLSLVGYCFYASDAKTLIATADLLGVSIDWLLGREGYPKNVPDPDTGPH